MICCYYIGLAIYIICVTIRRQCVREETKLCIRMEKKVIKLVRSSVLWLDYMNQVGGLIL
jgi:hypothetical protein